MTRIAQPPIIIIGMHRSGTSMITRMLEQLGLFVGHKKDRNHEADYFRQLNRWLLLQSGGSWDNPRPIHYLLDNDPVRALVLDHLRFTQKTFHTLSFLGLKKYLSYHSIEKLDRPWGWKDPVSTYTLPFWQAMFPEAKVIHIYRHGVDVAYSLQVRQEQTLHKRQTQYRKRKPFYYWRRREGGFTQSVRCTSLEGGFSLWEEYLEEAQRHVASLGSKALEIKYEAFLDAPYPSLMQLAEFCELDVASEEIKNVAGNIKAGRANAYRDKPDLVAFSQRVTDRLRDSGYEGCEEVLVK